MVLMAIAGFVDMARAELKLPAVLGSNMVLQRDTAVPIWGVAMPGEKVVAEFSGQQQTATADAKGQWRITLNAMKACAEPQTMLIKSLASHEKLEIKNILVGEVWLGSGQSNMRHEASRYVKDDGVLAKMIDAGPYPQIRLIQSCAGGWEEATPENIKNFSAQLFSFGLALQKDLNVPIGLLVGAVGATPSGYWLSADAYNTDQACKDTVAKYEIAYRFAYGAALKKYESAMEQWKKEIDQAKAEGVSADRLPSQPEAPLKAGECRGEIGCLYKQHISPFIPYAIRGVLWDQGENGTGIQGVDQYTLMGALIGGWRKDWNQPFAFVYVQKPSGGGCAWDDGDPVTARAEQLIPLPDKVPNDGGVREIYTRIRNYTGTFMSETSDLGPGTHPLNKSGYGTRAARVALGGVYGRNVEVYGPVYRSHKIVGNKVIVSFDHAGKGLAVKGDKLQGFALSEDGKMFVWADAVIDGDKVVVSSDKISKPVAVRYAWSQQHCWANLFNRDGLPAIEFRGGIGSK